ncbi:MAG: hypothetical protein IKS05_07020 [Oscillospiraceae bacterium]|nr:hypothetical protein [Oscillospiraceae bacterium]
MLEKSREIFGNLMPAKDVKKAEKTRAKFLRKYGDDSGADYRFALRENPVLSELGTKELVLGEGAAFSDKSVIVGNIRMGFGHYRISMAMASCARALGYEPLWLDLNSFQSTTCTKIISGQNDLYSLGSRLSQKSKLFNKLYWEPLNSEGFRKLSYNCADQASAELMAPLLKNLPKDIPYVATHVWPAQAAIHAGFTRVVNAIPDNWPMALHLAEGATHTIQTRSAWLGYKALRGMDKTRSLKPMPAGDIVYTGHYVDHELVANLEADTALRMERVQTGKAKRYLLTVGGAGAQQALFASVIRTLLPEIRSGRAALFINVGDHRKVWESLKKAVPELEEARFFLNDYAKASAWAEEARTGDASGITGFCHEDIFAAVYITNLLMRASDVLVTKPSELAFYPIPKLFIQHVGGHEVWGAIHAAEFGDGTYEVAPGRETEDMLRLLQAEPEILLNLNRCILENKAAGLYNGAYEVIRLALRRS